MDFQNGGKHMLIAPNTKRIHAIFIFLFLSLFASYSAASQSTITEAEGYSCMGVDKSRQQTEQLAMEDAKKKAVEYTVSYIKSETVINIEKLEKSLLEAYSKGKVSIIDTGNAGWYKDERTGDCYKIKIKAEVVPDEKAMETVKQDPAADNPAMPLKVKVWTDKPEYKTGEKMKIYLKGNKPFYVRIIYKDASGHLVQLLPNLYRRDNYFNGGVIYEVPTGDDRFELEVCPPCGEENLIVYASTAQLGRIDLEESKTLRGAYDVKTRGIDIGTKTRGVGVIATGAKKIVAAEFDEGGVVVRTKK
jgi:hypothetical protein